MPEERDDDRWLPAPSVDGRAARWATVTAVGALAVLVVIQPVVGAAVSGGNEGLRHPAVTGTYQPASVDRVPTVPAALAWSNASTRSIDLSAQQMAAPFGGGSVDSLELQAVTNDSHVGFRMTWQDPTRDTSLGAPTNYSDAAAVMLYNGEQPPITMGGSGAPVNIWYWRAAWGAPDTPYGTGDMYTYLDHTRSLPGRAADNPLTRVRYEQHAQNYYARGYGSLSHAASQPVEATAERTGQEWHVTFTRERRTDGAFDAAIAANETIYLAVAVWNGSAGEADGQKSISLQFTELDPESGELAAAAPGGDGGDGAAGGGDSTADGGLDTGEELVGWTGTLLLVVLTVWLLAYWSVRDT